MYCIGSDTDQWYMLFHKHCRCKYKTQRMTSHVTSEGSENFGPLANSQTFRPCPLTELQVLYIFLLEEN